MKAFFGYRKFDSVARMLLEFQLPSCDCDAVLHNF